jgi:GAF domain-containing protein
MSATPGSTLANFEQRIADLERQLAEREAERDEALVREREALERQTATAEVLQVINSSPGDLAPVFDAILEKAHTLCGAAHGGLLIREGDRFRLVAVHAEPRVAEYWRQLGPLRAPDYDAMAQVAGAEGIIHIADVMADDWHHHAPAAIRRLNEIAGARTLLRVLLRKNDAVLGVITAFRQEVRPFSDKQIALLQNFAAQAVIAMENARLLTETREALEQQTATAEVLEVINSSPGDLAPVFEEILDKAHTLCGAAYGGLLTYDGDAFQVAAARGDARFVEYWRQAPIRPPEGTPLWRVMRGEGLIQIIDAQAEDSYHSAPPYARLIDLGGVRTFLSLPLRKDDALLGVITAYRLEVRPFTDKQIALLQNFAAQAVIAMENARLLTETREALEQQTATAEVLGVINSSSGDLAPVFDAILEKAHALCGAEIGSLTIYDGEENRAVATRGLAPSLAGRLRQGSGPAQRIRSGSY